jgi:NAD(P)-dependent dehydrogenase (short-subunit alcohol dehydrogenase family)
MYALSEEETSLAGRRLEGRVALITGAGSGIGQGIAELFAEEGANVALLERVEERGRETQRRIQQAGGEALLIPTDVARGDEVQRAIGQTWETYGAIHHLVNNAGIVIVKPLEECSEEEWDEVMDTNLKSIFLTVKHALTALKGAEGATIVNMASVSSFVGQGHTPSYVASKGAVMMLTKSLALDYARYGIRVNCICPGITDTPLFRYHISRAPDPEATLADRAARVPLGRFLTPRDIAKAALYLSTNDSSGITGIAHVVDAGYLAAAEWDNRMLG